MQMPRTNLRLPFIRLFGELIPHQSRQYLNFSRSVTVLRKSYDSPPTVHPVTALVLSFNCGNQIGASHFVSCLLKLGSSASTQSRSTNLERNCWRPIF